jgi:hypothetical protein
VFIWRWGDGLCEDMTRAGAVPQCMYMEIVRGEWTMLWCVDSVGIELSPDQVISLGTWLIPARPLLIR